MCGICGIITKDGINAETLIRMRDTLSHRGPDDKGVFLTNARGNNNPGWLLIKNSEDLRDSDQGIRNYDIGLAHRRLSIIDLSGVGAQPMFNEDKTLCIVYNGEIYNYPELKEMLHGHDFKTRSDTEVIIHLFEEYGEDAFNMLNGMFALAIWDSQKEILYCARDRFGQKPFYYYKKNNAFIFGSEIRALLASGHIEKHINETVILLYYLFSYVPAPLTIYENLYKLPPGHMLTVTEKEIKCSSFVHRNYSAITYQGEPLEEVVERVDFLMDRAVKRHMISDVDVGIFLSGGLDSTAVLKYAAKYHSNIQSFSVTYNRTHDESEYISDATEQFPHLNRRIKVIPSVENIEKALCSFSEPFSDSAAIACYLLSEFAKNYVKVVLSGEGGDEFFAGYLRYRKILRLSPILSLSKYLFNCFYLRNINFMKMKEIKKYSRIQMRTYHHMSSVVQNNIESVIGHEQRQRLPDNHFVKIDTTTMANSLEGRAPFLDNEITTYLNSIPIDIKMDGCRNKVIIKKLLEPHFGEAFLERPKMGFGSPMMTWLRNPKLKDFMKDVLMEQQNSMLKIWDKQYYSRMLDNFTQEENLHYCIWVHFVFCFWLRNNNIEL